MRRNMKKVRLWFFLACTVVMLSCLGLGEAHDGHRNGDAPLNSVLTGTEAPAAFDDQSNGHTLQAVHEENKDAFDEVETVEDGLGPTYNAQSCRECHQDPVSGSASQVTELRVAYSGDNPHRGERGNRKPRKFNLGLGSEYRDPDVVINFGLDMIIGRSLINDRTICPGPGFVGLSAASKAPSDVTVFTERLSLNTLGDGFIEAIPDAAIIAGAERQCREHDGICGKVNFVPMLEAPGVLRVGRFGWKAQHASLLSFSADAYLNEMGITSPLLPEDVTSVCDTVEDPEDDGEDVSKFADFMRATKAPPRVPELSSSLDVQIGSDIFKAIGCATCHTPSFVTAPSGTAINGGELLVSEAIGDKIIHPYSDFLLHRLGTGDGIIQGEPFTENRMRTPPLWGLHVRPRFMHDGVSVTLPQAIERHEGEAREVIRNYSALSRQQKARLEAFLKSL